MYLWIAIGLFAVAVACNARVLYKNVKQLKTSVGDVWSKLKEIKKLLLKGRK